MSTAPRHRAAPVLLALLALAPGGAHAGFDLGKKLGQIGDAAKKAASEDISTIAQHAKDSAAGHTGQDIKAVVEGLKQAGETGAGKAMDSVNNSSSALHSLKETVKAVTNEVHRGAEQALNHSNIEHGKDLSGDVAAALKDAKDAASKAAEKAREATKPYLDPTVTKGAVDTGGLAGLINKTGQELAGAISKGAPKAAEAIKLSGKSHDHAKAGQAEDSGALADDDDSADMSQLGLAVGALSLAAVCGFLAYRQLKANASARAPGLLAEPDIGMQMRGGSNARLSAPGDEPYFTQF